MKTIAEIRLDNLELLIVEFGALERVAEKGDTSSVYLSQIRHRTPDAKTGKLREMGSDMARKLEVGCGKPRGWMDNPQLPPSYRQQRINTAVLAMENLPDDLFDRAVKIIDTLAEPAN